MRVTCQIFGHSQLHGQLSSAEFRTWISHLRSAMEVVVLIHCDPSDGSLYLILEHYKVQYIIIDSSCFEITYMFLCSLYQILIILFDYNSTETYKYMVVYFFPNSK